MLKIEAGQIWTIDNGVYKDPYLILSVRPKSVTVVMIEKYIKKSFYYGMVENIIYRESGMKFPSIPCIHSIQLIPTSKLKHQIATIDKSAYISIVNTIRDYFLGNIGFVDGKYKYVTDAERGPSREYLLDNVDTIEHRDQVEDLSPDIVVININEDSVEVQEDIKEDEVKIVDYNNNENLDKAIEKMLNTYGNNNIIDLKEMNQYYENYINSRKNNKTVRTSVKHRKSSKRYKHIIFNKDTIAYIFTHTPIQISAKFDISYSYACNVKKLLTQMIYGRKEKTKPKTTNIETYQNIIIEPKNGDYSMENLKRLNPMITNGTLRSHFKKDSFIDIKNRKCNTTFKFTFSKEELENITNEDLSKIKGVTNKINIIVDATMYRVLDKISPFMDKISLEDITLEKEELLSKYNIPLDDIDVDTIYKFICNSFSKKNKLDITETEIANLKNLKKFDELGYIKMASDICIRNAVHYNSLYKKINSSKVNYDLLNNCGTYNGFVEMIRSVSKETLVSISSITHNQNTLNNIKKSLDDDNIIALINLLNSVNNKQRVPLLNIIHELSNNEFKLYALEDAIPDNKLMEIHHNYRIKPETSLRIIKLTYPLLKNYLK